MADFVQSANVKSAVRKLASPIADVAAFDAIVQSVIADNPFACVAYMTAGVSHPPVEKTRESYVAKIVYQDAGAKSVGTASDRYNSVAGFNRRRCCDPRCSGHHDRPRRHRGPPAGFGDLYGNAPLSRCERRAVHGELQPGPGDPHLLLG